MRDENAPDPRDIVARVKDVPSAPKIDLDPRCKIHGLVLRRKADVGHVTRAIARRDVQAAAESDRQMCLVATNAVAL